VVGDVLVIQWSGGPAGSLRAEQDERLACGSRCESRRSRDVARRLFGGGVEEEEYES
jgi:hypothetical protein